MDLIQRDGFWWPADDGWCHKVIHQEVGDADVAINLAKDRTLAVQAGGNVGVWAAYLAKQFCDVVTVEPDATNYECLKRNVPDNVTHWRAGFGADLGTTHLNKVTGNAGAHFISGVTPDFGDIAVMTIDSLNLSACDLIILDIEGHEPQALRGAEQTIRKFHPAIMFEEKGLSERYYGVPRGTAEAWVLGLGVGYKTRHKIRADVILSV